MYWHFWSDFLKGFCKVTLRIMYTKMYGYEKKFP